MKVLNEIGVAYLWAKAKATFALLAHVHSAVTTSVNGFMIAADKSKLDGIAANANNYTHPSTHPPSIIAQDTSNRFVTDTEKSTWNGKQNALSISTTATANTIVQRDANGYIYGTHINSSRGVENTAAAQYIYDNGDGWMRKKTVANAKIELCGDPSNVGNASLRNIYAGTADMTAGSTSLTTGSIYYVYE